MKTLIATFAVALTLLGAVPASAQTATPGVTDRQIHQQQRIAGGVASGELTRREVVRLERGQARVARMKRAAKADGVVTAGERARLHHAQDVQSRRIYRQKHDAQAR